MKREARAYDHMGHGPLDQIEDNTGPGFSLPCYEDGFIGEVDHFINRCVRLGEPPLSTLDDAIDALRIIETAESAARNQQSHLKIPYAR